MGRFDRWARTDPLVRQTLQEAAGAGATLHHDGEGGVPAGMALHVYRRAGWACELCGTRDDLELDHLDGHPHATPHVPDQGGADRANNLGVLCHGCQDRIHDLDRELRR